MYEYFFNQLNMRIPAKLGGPESLVIPKVSTNIRSVPPSKQRVLKRKVYSTPTSNNPASPAFKVHTPDVPHTQGAREPRKRTKLSVKAVPQVHQSTTTPKSKAAIDKGKKLIDLSTITHGSLSKFSLSCFMLFLLLLF